MKMRLGEAAGALITIILFIVLPLAAQRYLPSQILLQLEEAGFDIQGFANQMVVLGLVLTAITVGKALTVKSSVTYLILEISSILAGLAFALLIVGAGDIGNLGYSSLSLSKGKQSTEITLDLRVFIYFSLGTVALRILQSVARFREARAEASIQIQA